MLSTERKITEYSDNKRNYFYGNYNKCKNKNKSMNKKILNNINVCSFSNCSKGKENEFLPRCGSMNDYDKERTEKDNEYSKISFKKDSRIKYFLKDKKNK